MSAYIPIEKSAAAATGYSAEGTVRLLADRYMAENPVQPFVWRTFDETGICADRQGRYLFDFEQRFPKANVGDAAVAVGELFCPRAKMSNFRVQCKNPAQIYVNGTAVYASDGARERSGEAAVFSVSLQEGWNRFVLRAEKTKIGFFVSLQNAMPQWEPCNYVMPFDDRQGEAGFVFRLYAADEEIPFSALFAARKEEGEWLPAREAAPLKDAGLYMGFARFETKAEGVLSWQKPETVKIRVDEKAADACLTPGWHTLHMMGPLDELEKVGARGIQLQPPVLVHGRCSPYLVLGPVKKWQAPGLGQLSEENLAWRPALSSMALRPYVEAFLFGRWTYPLGVTLYGMLKAGQWLGEDGWVDYVKTHVNQVTAIQDYAQYDTQRYGFAGVNQQLCWLDALDDCGSFGALILRCDPDGKRNDVRRLAGGIARYMMEEQPCTDEGAFKRRDDTVWADDMYMSVPFLCRYAGMTGETGPLDFAARQMLLYRQMLFMEDKKVMAHMRCLRHGQHNGIPWSRGNGWVIFSLSELLEALPETHCLRPQLLQFFLQLTEGYLALQDESGLWHQVLNDPESYLETSATAMFICAFVRGRRNGWLTGKLGADAFEAARKAWKGLMEMAIDGQGNLYGVCRGSGFSFSRAYYRSLSWNFNDTHGIGIVMLAGTELMQAEQQAGIR